MGGMGDDWRAHKEYLREKAHREGTTYYAQGLGHKRRATLVRFSKRHEKLGFRKCSDWHWQITLAGGLLDYWPSKSKWRYRGATAQGPEKTLLALIKAEKAT